MADIIIYLVISLLVSLIFIVLGVNQFRSKVPVALNTGEVSPREDELTDMTEWNHKHGRNLIIYGCTLLKLNYSSQQKSGMEEIRLKMERTMKTEYCNFLTRKCVLYSIHGKP